MTVKDLTGDYRKAVERFTGKAYRHTTERDLRAFLRTKEGKPYRRLFGMK